MSPEMKTARRGRPGRKGNEGRRTPPQQGLFGRDRRGRLVFEIRQRHRRRVPRRRKDRRAAHRRRLPPGCPILTPRPRSGSGSQPVPASRRSASLAISGLLQMVDELRGAVASALADRFEDTALRSPGQDSCRPWAPSRPPPCRGRWRMPAGQLGPDGDPARAGRHRCRHTGSASHRGR